MKKYDHLILPPIEEPYKYSPTGMGSSNIPQRNRVEHATMLEQKFSAMRISDAEMKRERSALSLPTRTGTYVEFKGAENHDLIFKSLEAGNVGVRLLNVRQQIRDNGNFDTYATVYIPHGQECKFLNKLRDYTDTSKDSSKGKPKNADLINSIDDINIAILSSFWTDSSTFFPTETLDWYETWLKIDETKDKIEQIKSYHNTLNTLSIEYKTNVLFFPERAVVLVYANKNKLIDIMNSSEMLAEIKKGQETAGFWCEESISDQREWVNDLLQRLIIDNESNVSVCILDSGVNNGHPLLSPIVSEEACLSYDPHWGSADRNGHGTMMAGAATYGDLSEILPNNNSISVLGNLCSIKILPNEGGNPKELWGDITQQAIYKAEIQFNNRQLIYCLAITAPECYDMGKPSSWSGALDTMSYGEGKSQRLILVSAGNIQDSSEIWSNYPEGNWTASVQNPAQAWNVLTIGAYTKKVTINDHRYDNHERVAESGGISPFSTTSVIWNKSWPIKPDVVFEEGNLIKHNDSDYPFGSHEDLEVLTTSKNFQFRQFETFNATSSATALATNLAAKIAKKYPELWPESVRGLMLHSAEWTDTMKRQFRVNGRTNIKELLRSCGYGVPNQDRALFSTDNGFTYISQSTIKPYVKNKVSVSCNEMHLYELPWPKELLESLGEVELTLRITLSYFIEPSPGEIGWKDKYRYPSFGLRFDVNNPLEGKEQFKKRINKSIQNEENDNIETIDNDSQRWTIGSKNRSAGSIHCDMITATGADLASCNMIAIFPIVGWWKTRTNLQKYNSKARYSLIISLDTPIEDISLYNTVKAKIEALIQTPVQITVPVES